jgi:hypothetical protein
LCAAIPQTVPRNDDVSDIATLSVRSHEGNQTNRSAELSQSFSLSGNVSVSSCESFVLWNAERIKAIESVVMEDNRSVRDYLAEGHAAIEIARLTGEGIRREGSRCLETGSEGEQGNSLCDEVTECDTIESLLRACAVFYTRETFLYRRVNTFLRSGAFADEETGRNLGLYIGLLRQCFCFPGESNPVQWEHPNMVYRGASFSVDAVIDYARRPQEIIRWQGFTSTSSNVDVALGFPGRVLFEISISGPVASLGDISVFASENEFILTPYQWFEINDVRWDAKYQRWVFSIQERSRHLSIRRSWLQMATAVAPRSPSTS